MKKHFNSDGFEDKVTSSMLHDDGDTPEQIAYDAAHYGTQASTTESTSTSTPSAPSPSGGLSGIGDIASIIGGIANIGTDIGIKVKNAKSARKAGGSVPVPTTKAGAYKAPKSSGSSTTIFIAIGAVVILGGLGYWYYSSQQAGSVAIAPAK